MPLDPPATPPLTHEACTIRGGRRPVPGAWPSTGRQRRHAPLHTTGLWVGAPAGCRVGALSHSRHHGRHERWEPTPTERGLGRLGPPVGDPARPRAFSAPQKQLFFWELQFSLETGVSPAPRQPRRIRRRTACTVGCRHLPPSPAGGPSNVWSRWNSSAASPSGGLGGIPGALIGPPPRVHPGWSLDGARGGSSQGCSLKTFRSFGDCTARDTATH